MVVAALARIVFHLNIHLSSVCLFIYLLIRIYLKTNNKRRSCLHVVVVVVVDVDFDV